MFFKLCLLTLVIALTHSIRIPLDNLTDPHTNRSYHIQIDFGSRHTVLPFRTKTLPLSSVPPIPIPSLQTNYSSNLVKIGLEHPSDFINAICKAYKVDPSEI